VQAELIDAFGCDGLSRLLSAGHGLFLYLRHFNEVTNAFDLTAQGW
jgi:hypothetical protein